MKKFLVALPLVALVAACGGSGSGSGAAQQLKIVGSSTVYPFTTAVAEEFQRANPGVSVIVESTGTGAGIKLFCGGVGEKFPDMVNASRPMKASEYADCAKAGAKNVIEVPVGIDGLTLIQAKGQPTLNLTVAQIYKALAAKPFGKDQTAQTWHDVDPSLPAKPILVYGPPSTSGTRDALKELILVKGCESDPAMKALKDSNKEQHDKVCGEVRSDGAYVDAGENDNLIVQKLEANPKAIGVFGFSYLEENADKLKGLTMGGITPTYATISDFSYPGARPLYIYVKAAHFNAIKGLKEFVAEWAKLWGKDGALAKSGMVVSPDDIQAKNAGIASGLTLLDPSTLK
jgi:phosphate transport system substrate-binding protein